MTLSEDTRRRLSQWCAAQVPASERARRQIGYTVQGDEVTIAERRAPVYPELDTAWASVPLVRLRRDSPHSDRWTLQEWAPRQRRWTTSERSGEDLVALLERYVTDPAA